jgi:hypothetical protein
MLGTRFSAESISGNDRRVLLIAPSLFKISGRGGYGAQYNKASSFLVLCGLLRITPLSGSHCPTLAGGLPPAKSTQIALVRQAFRAAQARK